jgi:hypothetical protein
MSVTASSILSSGHGFASDSPPSPRVKVAGCGKSISVALRDAAGCLYSQMYYWGQDVLHPGGNLLVAYGFTRVPKTTPGGTSRYHFAWREGTIGLHGLWAGWSPADGSSGVIFHRPQSVWRLWKAEHGLHAAPMEDGCDGSPYDLDGRRLMLKNASHLIGWIWEYETWARRFWGARGRASHHASYLRLRPRRWWLPPAHSLSWMREFASHPGTVPRPKNLVKLTGSSPVLPCGRLIKPGRSLQ